MPKNEKAEALIAKLEEDPTQALRLAIATVLLSGLNANVRESGTGGRLVEDALGQADALIALTIGV